MIKLSSFLLLNKLFCLASERTECDRVITDQLVKHVLLYWIEHNWHNVICLNLRMSPSEKMNNDMWQRETAERVFISTWMMINRPAERFCQRPEMDNFPTNMRQWQWEIRRRVKEWALRHADKIKWGKAADCSDWCGAGLVGQVDCFTGRLMYNNTTCLWRFQSEMYRLWTSMRVTFKYISKQCMVVFFYALQPSSAICISFKKCTWPFEMDEPENVVKCST